MSPNIAKVPQKCKKCAQPHSTKDCKGEAPFKCANCGGDHPASYVNCKARLTALARTKRFVHGLKVAPSTNEAEIPQGPWPPLESSTADLQTTQDTVPPALNLKDSPLKGKSKKSRPAAKSSLMDNQWPPRDPASSSGELNASGVPPSTAGTRPHSKTSTGALPRQQQVPSVFGTMTIGDIIRILFSVFRGLTPHLPPCTFKDILQRIMAFESAVIAMTGSSHQGTG